MRQLSRTNRTHPRTTHKGTHAHAHTRMQTQTRAHTLYTTPLTRNHQPHTPGTSATTDSADRTARSRGGSANPANLKHPRTREDSTREDSAPWRSQRTPPRLFHQCPIVEAKRGGTRTTQHPGSREGSSPLPRGPRGLRFVAPPAGSSVSMGHAGERHEPAVALDRKAPGRTHGSCEQSLCAMQKGR